MPYVAYIRRMIEAAGISTAVGMPGNDCTSTLNGSVSMDPLDKEEEPDDQTESGNESIFDEIESTASAPSAATTSSVDTIDLFQDVEYSARNLWSSLEYVITLLLCPKFLPLF